MSASSELHYRRPDTPYRVLSTIAKAGEASMFALSALLTEFGEPVVGGTGMATAVVVFLANLAVDYRASRTTVRPFAAQTGQFDDIREAGEGGAKFVVSGDAPRGEANIPTVQLLRLRDLPSEEDQSDQK